MDDNYYMKQALDIEARKASEKRRSARWRSRCMQRPYYSSRP